MKPAPDRRLRKVRSFVLREGRLTPAQQRALDELGPRYMIGADGSVSRDVFETDAPLVLDIGFGNGESLLHAATLAPDKNFIGIEVHRPGIGALLIKLAERGIDNVRVLAADAVEVLETRVPDASVDEIYLFFPDPWPKKRHHKRRIVQPDFAALVARKLVNGGIWHLATDWENYAEQMVEVLSAEPSLVNRAGDAVFSERPPWRPETKFERRGRKLGHGVWDLIYIAR